MVGSKLQVVQFLEKGESAYYHQIFLWKTMKSDQMGW